jgi:hypothetical protein
MSLVNCCCCRWIQRTTGKCCIQANIDFTTIESSYAHHHQAAIMNQDYLHVAKTIKAGVLIRAVVIIIIFGSIFLSCTQGDNASELYVSNTDMFLGIVTQGFQDTAEFVLINKGSDDLILSDFKGSCSCLQDIPTTIVIKPNMQRDFPIKIETGRSIGLVKRSLAMKTNDPRQLEVVLTASVEVEPKLKTFPARIDFRLADPVLTEPNMRQLFIRGSSSDFTVESVISLQENIEISNIEVVESNPPVYVITLHCSAMNEIPQRKEGIKVYTNDPVYSEITILVVF